MKIKRPASPRNTKGAGLQPAVLSELLSIIPNVLPLLPNDQIDNDAQSAEMASLWNFDFRDKKIKKLDHNKKEAKPTTLTLYGDKKFSDLFRLGSFVYAVKDPIAGLSHFGDLLFAMMNPIRLFEGRNTILESPRGKEQIKEINQRALGKASNLLEIGGLDYMKACFEYARDQAEGQIPILIVLGEQVQDRDVNCEPYHCRDFVTCCDRENNVHQYTTNQTAAKSGVFADIDIYHINMKAFENAQIDSADIEKLYDIYMHSIGNRCPRPLLIHCTDGMDRSGGLALAFQLIHNWGRIFTSLSAPEIVENITREHEAMQQQRGPSFCTAAAKRIHGAVLLACIMKAIQKAKELIERNDHLDPTIADKDYLQQIYILEDMTYEETELSNLLKARQALEKLYFEEFAPEINHPQVDMFIVDSILNGDFLTVKDTEKDELDQKFLYLKMNYKNQGFEDQALKSLVSLKCDVELYAIARRINNDLVAIENSSDQHNISEKLSKIDTIQNNKFLKLKRKKIVYHEIQVIKLYSALDAKITECPDGSIDSVVKEYYSLKKTLAQNFKEAHVTEPNVKKIENLVRRLENIQKKLNELGNQDKEASNVGEKTKVGSLRLETSPRSRRGSLFGLKLAQTTDAPQDETQLSTSPRSKLFPSLSPKGSRRGSRAVQTSEQTDSVAKIDEAEITTSEEPPLTQSGNLSASVSRFFNKLSPRGSRRGSVLVSSSQDELTSSSTRVPPPNFSPAPVVESEEFQQALTNLAEAQNKQAVSPRAGRKFSLSPRGSRKQEPPAPNRRKSLAADDDVDIGDQITKDLSDLGF